VLETAFAFRTISTVVAHFLHTEGVTSSNLVSSMLFLFEFDRSLRSWLAP
jgi:hypothetical protein